MPTLDAFFDAAKKIVLLGASTNAAGRQEIRDVVGQLADELDRALVLSDSYLVGVRYSRDDQDLIQYLQTASSKLLTSYHEHHVCAGLYQLADKFRQVFDPIRFSVSISSHQEIPALIGQLKNGERAILDDLDEIVAQLQESAYQLSAASSDQRDAVRLGIMNSVLDHRHQLDRHRKKIRTLRRQVIDKL